MYIFHSLDFMYRTKKRKKKEKEKKMHCIQTRDQIIGSSIKNKHDMDTPFV